MVGIRLKDVDRHSRSDRATDGQSRDAWIARQRRLDQIVERDAVCPGQSQLRGDADEQGSTFEADP
jgi:hypothetical protein